MTQLGLHILHSHDNGMQLMAERYALLRNCWYPLWYVAYSTCFTLHFWRRLQSL